MVEALRVAVVWDRLYLGGGNGVRVTAMQRAKLGPEVVIVNNDVGVRGGVRAWQLLMHEAIDTRNKTR